MLIQISVKAGRIQYLIKFNVAEMTFQRLVYFSDRLIFVP